MTDHSQSYPVSATEALIAKWRAAAKRHEAAAEEPNMDAQECTLHDECHRVYSKCADELASIGAAQAPAYPEGESQLPLQYEDGPDYCTVRDAQGRDFALTMRPDLMKAMERALAEDIAELSRPPAQAAVTPGDLSDFIGEQWWSGATCPSLASAILEKFDVRPKEASPLSSKSRGTLNPPSGAVSGKIEGATSTKYRGDMAVTSTDPRCTCAAIVNPNIPHARSCPLSSTDRGGK